MMYQKWSVTERFRKDDAADLDFNLLLHLSFALHEDLGKRFTHSADSAIEHVLHSLCSAELCSGILAASASRLLQHGRLCARRRDVLAGRCLMLKRLCCTTLLQRQQKSKTTPRLLPAYFDAGIIAGLY